MSDWLAENQVALSAELARIAATLEAHGDGRRAPESGARSAPIALDALVRDFDLSPFERDILLLCAGVELEARFLDLCGLASGADGQRRPTFSLALASLESPHWTALAPAAPLRRWRLVELDPGETIATRQLRIDERVLHYLAGLDFIDERLGNLVQLLEPIGSLPPSHETAAERVAAMLAAQAEGPLPVAVLAGPDAGARRDVAAGACARLGLRLFAISGGDIPADATERSVLARLWEREAILGGGALVIEVDDRAEPESLRSVGLFAEAARVVVFISAREPVPLLRRIAIQVDVARPSPFEQRRLWQEAVGPRVHELNGSLEELTAHFDLSAQAIASAALQGLADPGPLDGALWEASRAQARPRLDDLARRVEPVAGWDDLVLPSDQMTLLGELAAQVRHRTRVYDEWAFAEASSRGLGISALFEGPSGTGKTMAAEVLARELRLDLYVIDLSQVVSKYIGESEKNLRRIFDAAEGGMILLFDEADALFGKRSEVKSSHDRWANLEVSYLLQRMESYRGLSILTTNAKDALDEAFLRRIRFVVQFPFPDEAERTEIWRRIFPSATPTEALVPEALARLPIAGGNIRNTAINAAFLAASSGEPVGMSHIARAAGRECAKLERPLSDADVREWL